MKKCIGVIFSLMLLPLFSIPSFADPFSSSESVINVQIQDCSSPAPVNQMCGGANAVNVVYANANSGYVRMTDARNGGNVVIANANSGYVRMADANSGYCRITDISNTVQLDAKNKLSLVDTSIDPYKWLH